MKQQRDTRQRNLVLRVAQARTDHPTADQIAADVRAIDPRVSRATVYRNLHLLAANGKLNHIKMPGADRFDRRADAHYHLLCSRCGAVCDVPAPYQQELDRMVERETGCLVERHHMVFEGLCPECRKKCDQNQ